MALYVEILPGSRMDDRGKELLQRIEDTFPTDGEFVCRISEAEFALAAPIAYMITFSTRLSIPRTG